MTDAAKLWGCNDCSWIGRQSALLVAPNPFDPTDNILGCPQCKAIGSFWEVCDEPCCKRQASCGFPTETGGYRRTCGQHSL